MNNTGVISMEKINLKDGDIIELEGKKYYMEYYDGRPCGWCALSGKLCNTYFGGRNGRYSCSSNCVYAISAEKKIEELKEEIREREELIKNLSNNE